jgi:hypothetical protein
MEHHYYFADLWRPEKNHVNVKFLLQKIIILNINRVDFPLFYKTRNIGRFFKCYIIQSHLPNTDPLKEEEEKEKEEEEEAANMAGFLFLTLPNLSFSKYS